MASEEYLKLICGLIVRSIGGEIVFDRLEVERFAMDVSRGNISVEFLNFADPPKIAIRVQGVVPSDARSV